MKNPTDIRTLADSRVKEAQALSKKGFHDLAFYVAGYAVELQLKAKICEHFDLPDFYSQYAPKTDLSKTFLIHNLEKLMLLSGSTNLFGTCSKGSFIFNPTDFPPFSLAPLLPASITPGPPPVITP